MNCCRCVPKCHVCLFCHCRNRNWVTFQNTRGPGPMGAYVLGSPVPGGGVQLDGMHGCCLCWRTRLWMRRRKRSFRKSPTTRKLGSLIQHVLTVQDPDIPWHLHSCCISDATVCRERNENEDILWKIIYTLIFQFLTDTLSKYSIYSMVDGSASSQIYLVDRSTSPYIYIYIYIYVFIYIRLDNTSSINPNKVYLKTYNDIEIIINKLNIINK